MRMESGVVTIERRIGGEDAPDAGIQTVMVRYDLADGYAPAALAEAESLELDVESALQDPLRRDIRDRFLLTIDPVDARDFDDAISVEAHACGRLGSLGCISPTCRITCYGRVLSILRLVCAPPVSTWPIACCPCCPSACRTICAPWPHEDRLAFTVDIELDARGRVLSSRAYPSVIQSRVRLDYDAADWLLRAERQQAMGKTPRMSIWHAWSVPSRRAETLPPAGSKSLRFFAMPTSLHVRARGLGVAAVLSISNQARSMWPLTTRACLSASMCAVVPRRRRSWKRPCFLPTSAWQESWWRRGCLRRFACTRILRPTS